jgi:flagellin-like hook-associated protein FlgL
MLFDFAITGKFSTYDFMTNLPLNSNARSVRSAALAAAAAGRSETSTRNTYAADVEIRAANARADAFSALRSKLNTATKTLDKATERLEEVKDILLDMQKRITLAQKTGVTATERTAYAQQFDQLLGDLNLRVKTAGYSGTNLIGTSFRDSFTPDDLEYRERPDSRATVTVSGEYLGSDYYIEDANGDRHYPTIYGSSLVIFPNADENDAGTLLKSDDQISYDSGSGAISITADGAGAPHLSGTLVRKGLGVVHSWLYGDFQSTADMDTALSDVNDALSTIRNKISVFSSHAKQAAVRYDFTKQAISDNRNAASKISTSLQVEESRASLLAQRRQLLVSSAITSSLTYNANGLLDIVQGGNFSFDT